MAISRVLSLVAVTGLCGLVVLWALTLGPITVVDGDTVDRGLLRYRLVGFDTPEIRQAQCPEERAKGQQAARRLTELIEKGAATIIPVRWKPDRYWRVVARLEIDGRDVGNILISEGLARPYDGRTRRISWCAGP
ncbi:thermonuclease family protein [Leptospira interrogans]